MGDLFSFFFNFYFRELEVAVFEPHLLQAVAKNAVKTLNMFCVKSESLVMIVYIYHLIFFYFLALL